MVSVSLPFKDYCTVPVLDSDFPHLVVWTSYLTVTLSTGRKVIGETAHIDVNSSAHLT
jgi:hypothetical protein